MVPAKATRAALHLRVDGSVFAIAVRSRSDCEETAYLGFKDHGAWLAQNARDVAQEQNRPVPAWATTILDAPKQNPSEITDAAITPAPRDELAPYGGGCSVQTGRQRPHAAIPLLGTLCILFASRRSKRDCPRITVDERQRRDEW